MPAFEPGKIRNVAVVGHRGTGKTSLVEALLFQAGETNRLGTIEAGSTVADWDDDEQQRQDVDLALAHARRVAGPEDQPDRRSRRPELPGRGALLAPRRRRGALSCSAASWASRSAPSRVWKRAEELGLARVLFVNMLDRERADFFRALAQLQEQLSPRCVAVHLPIGSEHELTGIVDVLHMCAYTSPEGEKEPEPGPIPDEHGRPRPGVPREAARRGRPDRRGADGALPRRRRSSASRRSRTRSRRRSRAARSSRSPAASRRRTSARTRCST